MNRKNLRPLVILLTQATNKAASVFRKNIRPLVILLTQATNKAASVFIKIASVMWQNSTKTNKTIQMFRI